MRDVEVSAEVADRMSDEDLRLLAARAVAEGFECAVCRQRAVHSDQDPASVVVYREWQSTGSSIRPSITQVRLVHYRCGDSRVVELAPGSLRAAEEARATADLWYLPSTNEIAAKPAVVVDMGATLAYGTKKVRWPMSEQADEVLCWLMSRGLAQIGVVNFRQSDLVERTAPHASGWSVRLFGSDGLRVEGRNGLVIFDGTVPRQSTWVDLADDVGGRCDLLVGVDLDLASDTLAKDIRRLREVVRSGRLVGGLVPVDRQR